MVACDRDLDAVELVELCGRDRDRCAARIEVLEVMAAGVVEREQRGRIGDDERVGVAVAVDVTDRETRDVRLIVEVRGVVAKAAVAAEAREQRVGCDDDVRQRVVVEFARHDALRVRRRHVALRAQVVRAGDAPRQRDLRIGDHDLVACITVVVADCETGGRARDLRRRVERERRAVVAPHGHVVRAGGDDVDVTVGIEVAWLEIARGRRGAGDRGAERAEPVAAADLDPARRQVDEVEMAVAIGIDEPRRAHGRADLSRVPSPQIRGGGGASGGASIRTASIAASRRCASALASGGTTGLLPHAAHTSTR